MTTAIQKAFQRLSRLWRTDAQLFAAARREHERILKSLGGWPPALTPEQRRDLECDPRTTRIRASYNHAEAAAIAARRPKDVAVARQQIALLDYMVGDWRGAVAGYTSSLQQLRACLLSGVEKSLMSTCYFYLADLALREGRAAEAHELGERALNLDLEMGDSTAERQSRELLARIESCDPRSDSERSKNHDDRLDHK